ncbi:MAG: hypothetical protein ACHQYQ_07075, partial [Bacteriovoracales bacterium]
IININQILSKLFLILAVSGWVNTLHADCSEEETKAIITQEIGELKKNGFFDFKLNLGPAHQEYESRYYFTTKKKDSLGIDQVYGGLLVTDIRVCDGPKALNLERLKPLIISDFIKPRVGMDEGCSWDAAKIIFYENLPISDYPEYRWRNHFGSMMKSWEFYEFIYTVSNTDDMGHKIEDYLGRMEISRANCNLKYHDMIPL